MRNNTLKMKSKAICLILPFSPEQKKNYNNYAYAKPYCRIQPFLLGFILGYAFYVKCRGPVKRRGWVS